MSFQPPLVAHIIQHLIVGGLENGLVNLINHMPSERYRHAIICLSHFNDFRQRIRRPDVPVIALHKQPGHDLGVYARLWRELRRLKPSIVHTRNLPSLEYQTVAALAGVRGRIHGEHGRDVYDLDGTSRRYRMLRSAMRLWVHRYIAVSADLSRWLREDVGISPRQIRLIYNGVDLERFKPQARGQPSLATGDLIAPANFVVGTVGRMQAVKGSLTLVQAFVRLVKTAPGAAQRLRLIMVGDGPLREQALQLLRDAGADSLAWLPGEREDVPDILARFDVFVLPSLAEGISNTILEAMACGLPIIATRVGGNPELVHEGENGTLVPSENPPEMSKAILHYLNNEDGAKAHGRASRLRVCTQFSLDSMVQGYLLAYDEVLARAPTAAVSQPASAKQSE
jgi:sugar transferase (PEP-CTERM/EpsH1 system associated)